MTQTSDSTAIDTVVDYHRAWTSGDIEQALTLVADDVVCHAPGEDLVGKDAYGGFLAGFAPSLTGVSEVVSFADGDRVALIYYPHTAVISTAPVAELFTLRDGIIAESVLVFDRVSFAPPDQQ